MHNVHEKVRGELSRVLTRAFSLAFESEKLPASEVPPIPIELPRDPAHGDFASPIAMVLTKAMRMPPRKIAEAVLPFIEREKGAYIERVEVAGPGFINFSLTSRWLKEVLEAIEEAGERYGEGTLGAGQKVLVEFVSANPTGPMNVVNARASAYGDALCNILEKVGYQVSREYYINDAGNQVEILGKSLELRYRELLGEKIEFPPECYQGDYIIDLAREALREHGSEIAALDSAGRREFFKEFACRRIIEKQRRSLSEFGVEFDTWFSERNLVEEGADRKVLEELRARGMLYEADGAVWFRSTAFGDDKDRVVVKSDGSFTYLLRDLAYHRNKLERGFDKLIDIWGPDHHGYVARTRAGIQALGYPGDKLEVILLQLVTLYSGGQQVRMSKRKGEFITLDELVEEVGRDAARYFFVMRNADSPLDFDLELAVRQSQENPVYYVQYAHARVASILRQALEAGIPLPRAADIDIGLLSEKLEVDLIKKLAAFPDEVDKAARERSPNRIAAYALDLAGTFHSFYNSFRVISSDRKLTDARLVLVRAVQTVERIALGLLGVSAPDRM